MARPRTLHVLAHPAFLVALAVLLVNDHVLKAAAPSALTGKLSDFAGLVVLPVLLCALWGVTARRRVWLVHGVVGALFAVLQFVDLSAALKALHTATGLQLAHTPDPTDLVALAVLPLGVALALRAPQRESTWLQGRFLQRAALALSLVAVVGTSKPPAPSLFENEGALIERARSADEAFRALERVLAESDVYARTDTTEERSTGRDALDYLDRVYEVTLDHTFPAASLRYTGDPPTEPDTVRTVTGWLRFVYDPTHGGLRLAEDGGFETTGRGEVEPEALRDAVRRRVLDPIRAADADLPGL